MGQTPHTPSAGVVRGADGVFDDMDVAIDAARAAQRDLVALGMEYSAHWHGLIFPGSKDEIERYYAYYDKLFFFGPFENRIAPDLYYLLLDFLLLGLVWIGMKRVALRAYH